MFGAKGGKSLSSRRAMNRGKGCGIGFLIGFFTLWNAFIVFAAWGLLTKEDAPPWTALILVPFVAVGIFGIVLIRRALRAAREEASADDPLRRETAEPAARSRVRAPLACEPKSRIVPFVLALVFCVFWNGIVTVFLTQEGFTCFMVPFAAVGLLLVVAVVYAALATMNPRVTLHVERHPLLPGVEEEIRFEIQGSSHRIATLEILLEGEERATYRQGTNTHTATNVFYSQSLTTLQQDGEMMHGGSLRLRVPEQAVPSFDGNNNKIVWHVRVHGDIKLWPDVNDKFEMRVMSPASEGRS